MSDLWDGEEQPESESLSGSDPVQPDAAPIGVEPIVRQWLEDLSFDEVHAFGVGLVTMWAGLLLLAIPGVWAIWGNVLLSLAVALGVTAVIGIKTGRSRELAGYVALEPHYVLAGLAVGSGLGAVSMALVNTVVWLGGVVT